MMPLRRAVKCTASTRCAVCQGTLTTDQTLSQAQPRQHKRRYPLVVAVNRIEVHNSHQAADTVCMTDAQAVQCCLVLLVWQQAPACAAGHVRGHYVYWR